MSIHTPDKWIVVKVIEMGGEPVHKVFAGWYGGYCDSDSWKLSSGITDIKENDDYFEFHNVSGSVYKCLRSAYGMNGIMHRNYEYWDAFCKSEGVGSIEIVDGYEPG